MQRKTYFGENLKKKNEMLRACFYLHKWIAFPVQKKKRYVNYKNDMNCGSHCDFLFVFSDVNF